MPPGSTTNPFPGCRKASDWWCDVVLCHAQLGCCHPGWKICILAPLNNFLEAQFNHPFKKLLVCFGGSRLGKFRKDRKESAPSLKHTKYIIEENTWKLMLGRPCYSFWKGQFHGLNSHGFDWICQTPNLRNSKNHGKKVRPNWSPLVMLFCHWWCMCFTNICLQLMMESPYNT